MGLVNSILFRSAISTHRIVPCSEEQLSFQLMEVEPVLRLTRLLVHSRQETTNILDDFW